MSDKYAYRVMWSEEDKEYVGLCAEFPSLSWLDKSQDNAFRGIRKLVAETIEDMKSHHEPNFDSVCGLSRFKPVEFH